MNPWINPIATLIGSIIGAVIGAVVAIYIFNRGNSAQKKTIEKTKWENEKKLKDYYVGEIKYLLKPIREQARNLAQYSKVLASTEMNISGIKRYSALYIGVLNETKRDSLYHIFVELVKKEPSKAIKVYHKMTESLLYIRVFMIDLFDKRMDTFQSIYSYNEDLYNNNMRLVRRFFAANKSANMRQNIPPERDPFLMYFDQILGAWQEIDDFENHHIAQDYAIIPLKKLCHDYFQDYRAPELMNFLIDAEFALLNIHNLRVRHSSLFQELSDTLYEKACDLEAFVQFHEMRK